MQRKPQDIVFCEGAIELLQEMAQSLQQGKIKLTYEDWQQWTEQLDEIQEFLSKSDEKISELEAEQIGWGVISAFEAIPALGKYFSAKLEPLTCGTIPISYNPGVPPAIRRDTIKNLKVELESIEQIKLKTPKPEPKPESTPVQGRIKRQRHSCCT